MSLPLVQQGKFNSVILILDDLIMLFNALQQTHGLDIFFATS